VLGVQTPKDGRTEDGLSAMGTAADLVTFPHQLVLLMSLLQLFTVKYFLQPEYAQVSSNASSGEWEDQVTSGHFDRALREADFELEHVPRLRIMTVHKSPRTQVQRSTDKNCQTPKVSRFRLLVIVSSALIVSTCALFECIVSTSCSVPVCL